MASLPSNWFNVGERKFDLSCNFEAEIKKRLFWSNEKWKFEGEQFSNINSFVNSVRYWAKKLEKAIGPKNVLFTLYGLVGDVSEKLQSIVDEITKIDNSIKIKGFSTFRNTKYIAIYFENEEIKLLVEKNLKRIDNMHVAFLSWSAGLLLRTVKVHWIPYDLEMQIVRDFLNGYFILSEEERETRMLLDGSEMPSGIVSYKAEINSGVNIDDIPHECVIGGFECLITVQGRQIMCLTCGIRGHKSKFCSTPYCNICKDLRPKGHVCVNTGRGRVLFAAVVESDDLGDLESRQVGSNIGKENEVEEKNELLDNNENEHHDGKVGSYGVNNQKNNVSLNAVGANSVQIISEEISEQVDAVQETGGKKLNLDAENEGGECSENPMGILESYMNELRSFEFPKQEACEAISGFIKAASAELEETNMEGIENALKRKLSIELKSSNAETLLKQNRRTYSKRGVRVNSGVTDRGQDLFDALVDKG